MVPPPLYLSEWWRQSAKGSFRMTTLVNSAALLITLYAALVLMRLA